MIKGKTEEKWPLIGNNKIGEYLTKSMISGKLAGSYIFAGPPDLGKATTARYFAKILLCQSEKKEALGMPCGICPSCRIFAEHGFEPDELAGRHGDFHYLKKSGDKKNISIEQVRELINKLSLGSFLNSYKVGIIKNAQHLSIEAANALLKTLEEPKRKVVIVLTASDPDLLPATIVSRSVVLKFKPVKMDTIHDHLLKAYKITRSAAKHYAHASLGKPALAVKMVEDKDFFSRYSLLAGSLLAFAYKSTGERFMAIDELAGRKTGQELADAAREMLGIWQGVTRDLMLIHSGNSDLIQNEFIGKELEKLKNKFSLKKVLALNEAIVRANEYIKTNVNPKLALENAVMEL